MQLYKEKIVKQAESDPNFGTDPNKRDIKELINFGIVNINKPSGPTSHQVVDYVKKILSIDKAGHSGTLDPKVTGVLLVALGKATRITEVFLTGGKEYVALMYLHSKVPKKTIIDTFKEFTGEIEQLPPVRSAVKRQKRKREIYYLKILEIKDQHILFRVGCEAGTYVRKLIHDMSLKMGTKGHMTQLVRTKVGPYTDKNWHSLHDLADAYHYYKSGDETELKKMILPIESSLVDIPKIWVFDSAVNPLCHGAFLYNTGISKLTEKIEKNSLVVISTLKNELIGLGKSLFSTDEILKIEKDIVVKLEKVFMQRNLYPSFKS